MGRGGLEVLQLWHHSQKICNSQPKIFFKCILWDLPHLLSLWTTLHRFRRLKYACAKPHAILFFGAKISESYQRSKCQEVSGLALGSFYCNSTNILQFFNPWSWIFIIFGYVFLDKILSSMQKKFLNRMCGSQVMRGLILETTRWQHWYQEKKPAFLWSTVVKVMMKHSIPIFSYLVPAKNCPKTCVGNNFFPNFFKTYSQKVHLSYEEKIFMVFFYFFGELRLHFSKFFPFFYYGGHCISINFLIKSLHFKACRWY